MNRTIHKYVLRPDTSEGAPPSRLESIVAPVGAEWLSVAIQDSNLVAWAKVNPEEEGRHYQVRAYTTGNPIEEEPTVLPWKFIGTLQYEPSPKRFFVWHVFIEQP